MKVNWTDTAEGHLDAIYAYISVDSMEYAKRMVDRITRRSQQIADFPFHGLPASKIMKAIRGPLVIRCASSKESTGRSDTWFD